MSIDRLAIVAVIGNAQVVLIDRYIDHIEGAHSLAFRPIVFAPKIP
jgi:hypothetical protein